MKNRKIKTSLFIGALVICLTLVSRTYAQTKIETMAGTWSLNEDKSEFGRLTAASAVKVKTLQVTQAADAMTIKTGDDATKYTFVIKLAGGQSLAMVSQVVSGIPNTLTADMTLQLINNRSFKTTNRDPMGVFASQEKIYNLSNDGKTLTIAYEYKDSKGDQLLAGKLVYDMVKSAN